AAACLLAAACGGPRAGDGVPDATVPDTGAPDAGPPDAGSDAGSCPPVGVATELPLDVADVALAAAGDLLGTGRLSLVVAPTAGGVVRFDPTPCGTLQRGAASAATQRMTGLDVVHLGPATNADAVAFGQDRTLYALAGPTLAERWSAPMTMLGT